MMEASPRVPAHAEPRAAITASSKVPTFYNSSSNILSSPVLYEDLIFPCVSCQVSLSVKLWCFLHDRLVSVVQTHHMSPESVPGPSSGVTCIGVNGE